MPSRSPRLQQRLSEFGEAVRSRRLEAGLSQEELAHLAGVHRTYIGSVERGERNVSLGNAWGLADALQTTVGDLVRAGDHVS